VRDHVLLPRHDGLPTRYHETEVLFLTAYDGARDRSDLCCDLSRDQFWTSPCAGDHGLSGNHGVIGWGGRRNHHSERRRGLLIGRPGAFAALLGER
jgi:hypothetical protein